LGGASGVANTAVLVGCKFINGALEWIKEPLPVFGGICEPDTQRLCKAVVLGSQVDEIFSQFCLLKVPVLFGQE
jgi:hypothetical protein